MLGHSGVNAPVVREEKASFGLLLGLQLSSVCLQVDAPIAVSIVTTMT